MAYSSLETPRLTISPFSQEHLTEAYVEWLNDKDLMRYSEQRHYTHTLETCRAYAASFEGTNHYFWAIVTKKEMRHIGNMTAYVDTHNQIADVSLLIGADDARGKGYGFEAWNAVMEYLLYELKLRKVTAGTLAANEAMRRIMEKSGMVLDGIRRNHYLIEGASMDMILMARFSSSLIDSNG